MCKARCAPAAAKLRKILLKKKKGESVSVGGTGWTFLWSRLKVLDLYEDPGGPGVEQMEDSRGVVATEPLKNVQM